MSNITIIDPVGYLDMVWLIGNCYLVMTDSGGLQKEAFFFKKRCLVLREETEWMELVEAGFNELVGSDFYKIIEKFNDIDVTLEFNSVNFYGDGKASENIVKTLLAIDF